MPKERQKFQIGEDDWKELMDLSEKARNTPVIALSVQAGLEGRDFSALALKAVHDQWEDIGKKYGFDGTDVVPLDATERTVLAYPAKKKREPIIYDIPDTTRSVLCKGRGCGEGIFWIKTKTGANMPVNADGSPHWGTCPAREQFKRKKGKMGENQGAIGGKRVKSEGEKDDSTG